MPTENERKWLLPEDSLPADFPHADRQIEIRQAYPTRPDRHSSGSGVAASYLPTTNHVIMSTFRVEVTQEVEVTIDEDEYTEDDLEAFREDFYNFMDYEDHAEHLAQLKARGHITDRQDDCVEGYGPLDEAGIRVSKIQPPRVEVVGR